MMDRHPIQGVVLPCAQCSRDRLWNLYNPEQDKVVSEEE